MMLIFYPILIVVIAFSLVLLFKFIPETLKQTFKKMNINSVLLLSIVVFAIAQYFADITTGMFISLIFLFLLLTCSYLKHKKTMRILHEYKLNSPNSPWEWNETWVKGIINSRMKAKIIPNLLYTIVLSFYSYLSWFDITPETKHFRLVLFIFFCASIYFFIKASFNMYQYFKYRAPTLHTLHNQYFFGGSLKAQINIDKSLNNKEFSVQLKCEYKYISVRYKSPVNNCVDTLYLSDPIKLTSKIHSQESLIDIEIKIPSEFPETTIPVISHSYYVWVIVIMTKVGLLTYKDEFEVPVFKQAS